MKILAYMITRADTDKRRTLFESTLRQAKETAGYPMKLSVQLLPPASDYYFDHYESLAIEDTTYQFHTSNVGQHVLTNNAIAKAKEEGYELLLRLDDDCKFVTTNWLAKMVAAYEKLGDDFVISPTIQGLLHPPERSEVVEVNGVKVQILYNAIGGICRLHSVKALTESDIPYVSDVRGPLGFGDATGMAKWLNSNVSHEVKLREEEKHEEANKIIGKWMVYLPHVKVKHNTAKQREEDPAYHKLHGLLQHIPYIPINLCDQA